MRKRTQQLSLLSGHAEYALRRSYVFSVDDGIGIEATRESQEGVRSIAG